MVSQAWLHIPAIVQGATSKLNILIFNLFFFSYERAENYSHEKEYMEIFHTDDMLHHIYMINTNRRIHEKNNHSRQDFLKVYIMEMLILNWILHLF